MTNGTQAEYEKRKRQKSLHTDSEFGKKNKHKAEDSKRRNTTMIFNMYALKDELNGFTSPIPFNNEELAKRYLRDQTIENPTIKNTPKDFSLWRIGAYDTEKGLFSQKEGPQLIERAENYAN